MGMSISADAEHHSRGLSPAGDCRGSLALLTGDVVMQKWRRVGQVLFVAAAVLVSIRAIGMTTWGVLCARDVSRAGRWKWSQRNWIACLPAGRFCLGGISLWAAGRANITAAFGLGLAGE